MTKRLSVLLLIFCSGSCKKYLDKKPDESLTVPARVLDFRMLLDNQIMTTNSTPGLGAMAVDDYTMDSAAWLTTGAAGNGIYNWQSSVYQGSVNTSWSNPYKVIYTANVVLDGMKSLTRADSPDTTEFNAVYGSALFFRAFEFYNLEETFGLPYHLATADVDKGIPLRLTADALEEIVRSNVKTVFQQIDSDLAIAIPLLPVQVPRTLRNRPNRPAAWALRARVALTRQDYPMAKKYADSCLALYSVLASYDTIRTTSPRPFYPGTGNDEVLFMCSAVNYPSQYATSSLIDSGLYNSYATDDLRRTVFFQKGAGNGYSFRGQYTGLLYLFTGMATDEIYLIRAECSARAGDVGSALSDLNTLLSHRFKSGTYYPFATTVTADEALQLVLMEKRKETLFRDLRWSDLRRLNQDNRFATTLKRTLGSRTYLLPPDDPRYTFLIPDEEIRLSGIAQNPQ